MKKITPFLSLSFFLASAVAVPFAAQAKPLFESSPKAEQSFPESSSELGAAAPGRMAAYKDCVNVHSNVNGADFSQVNKFCACVADQSIQGGSGNLSDCAMASSSTGEGKTGGGMMSVIGDVAPSVITGVMEGFSNRSKSGGGGLFGGGSGGGLFGGLGGLLGGGDGGGGFNIKDLLKNRL
jgi:hypothetical protein